MIMLIKTFTICEKIQKKNNNIQDKYFNLKYSFFQNNVIIILFNSEKILFKRFKSVLYLHLKIIIVESLTKKQKNLRVIDVK